MDSRSKPFLADLTSRANRPLSRLDRSVGLALGLAVHAILLLVLFNSRAIEPAPPELPPVVAELIAPPAPVPAPSSGAPPAAAAPKPKPVVKKPKPPPPAPIKAREPKKIPPPKVRTIAAAAKVDEPEEPVPEVSESQVAGATRAGTGQGAGAGSGKGEGGGSCDLARAIQNALRKDALVQASVAEAHRIGSGKAMVVWNGDWVRSHSQEGRGLSAVREAIIWEVGFASETCRNQPMRGLVLFNLNQSRLVVGKDGWRWSDLLNLRR